MRSKGHLGYASSVARLIHSVAAAYSMAIMRILTRSQTAATDIHLIGHSDLEQVLQWNATKPTPVRACLHDLVEKPISRRPTEPAVCAWDGQATYEQLDSFSTNLARRICEAVPECFGLFIPILMDKSLWAVVGMLAILWANCAFVPIDPKHPASRHQEVLRKTQAAVVVTSSKYATSLMLQHHYNGRELATWAAHQRTSMYFITPSSPTFQPTRFLPAAVPATPKAWSWSTAPQAPAAWPTVPPWVLPRKIFECSSTVAMYLMDVSWRFSPLGVIDHL